MPPTKVWNSVKINEVILDPNSGYGEMSGLVFPGENMFEGTE